MHRDIREFIAEVDRMGELKRVDGADPNIEMGAIIEVVAESTSCPALLFDNIKGYPKGHRVIASLLHTPRRLALALGLPLDLDGVEFVKAWKDKLHFGRIPPVVVNNAPFREKITSGADVNVLTLPAGKWHEQDGGVFIGSGAISVVRDPDSGYANAGIYRVQVYDRSTLGMMNQASAHMWMIRQKYWAKGKNCPVAVCFSVDPNLWIASLYQSVPFGVSEFDVAGWLRGSPIEVFNSDLTGLPLPANAELIIEGEIPPPEKDSRTEGPFGEFTGYYGSGSRPEPVVYVKRVMHRESPIILHDPPMKPVPGLYHFGINWRAALIWSDLDKAGLQGIKGVWQLGANLTIISLKQLYPGHAKQVGVAASSSFNANATRVIVLLDDDVDPSNMSEAMWAMSSRCDPEEIDIVRGLPSQVLDARLAPANRENGDLTRGRAIINACRPYHWKEVFPLVNQISPELKEVTKKKWGHLLD